MSTPEGNVPAGADARYRQLFERGDPRFVVTDDWTIIDANHALARMLGVPSAQALIGRRLVDFAPDAPMLQKLLAVARVERQAGPIELQVGRADDSAIDVACSLWVDESPPRAGPLFSGEMREITDRRRLEMRLQGAERMEAIGRLAGGLAHDFNNLLTVISGNAERILEGLGPADPLRQAASAIDEAAGRAAAMTRQLLAYGRRQVFELRPLSLATLIEDVRPLLVETLGSHISVEVSLAADVPLISADRRQIEQVLANLALNARDAMPDGGRVHIDVDAIEVTEHAPRQQAWLRPGRYVRLVMRDTGHGMDPVTRAYAFQPFFTTKRMGNGRGLGLATVYGIVKQSRGFVWVESEAGRGAVFTLLFPAIRPGSEPASTAVQGEPHETILIVESSESARAFAANALRRRGYPVVEAATGDEALQVFASHASRVHLVLADRGALAHGQPLVGRLKAIDPRLQSLVMLEPREQSDATPPVLPTTPSIQKPFTLQTLADKVREVLDSGVGRN